ncbi:MAG: proton-conducting transporter membrane subunit [Gammaproteobacteria bacterium]
MGEETLLKVLALGLVGLPLLGFIILCLLMLIGRTLTESGVARLCRSIMIGHLVAVITCLVIYLSQDLQGININLGHWYLIGHYGFEITLLMDGLSCPLLLVCSFLLNVISYFCVRYLHRDRGYFRFCALYLLFAGGISLVIVAGTVDLLFAGWELLGISSALLIGFYHERRQPAENGLHAFIYYRFCDIALLTGAVVWHHYAHTSAVPMAFSSIETATQWDLSATQFTLVSLFFILASLAKSAQFPLSGWLPKAMEGPTPSSAIFYGALSIHAGAYFLIRLFPIIDQSFIARATIVSIGALTTMYGAFIGRTRSDVKTILAYAAMTQVGIIYIEIGLGWTTLALVHMIGHSLIRSLQFLRSPSVLHDFHHIGHEPILGSHSRIERLLPQKINIWVYRQALGEGNLDAIFRVLLVRPIHRLSSQAIKIENRFIQKRTNRAGEKS